MTELSWGKRAACGHYFQRPSRVLRGQFFWTLSEKAVDSDPPRSKTWREERCGCGPDICETRSSIETSQQPDASSGTHRDAYLIINIVLGKLNMISSLNGILSVHPSIIIYGLSVVHQVSQTCPSCIGILHPATPHLQKPPVPFSSILLTLHESRTMEELIFPYLASCYGFNVSFTS